MQQAVNSCGLQDLPGGEERTLEVRRGLWNRPTRLREDRESMGHRAFYKITSQGSPIALAKGESKEEDGQEAETAPSRAGA